RVDARLRPEEGPPGHHDREVEGLPGEDQGPALGRMARDAGARDRRQARRGAGEVRAPQGRRQPRRGRAGRRREALQPRRPRQAAPAGEQGRRPEGEPSRRSAAGDDAPGRRRDGAERVRPRQPQQHRREGPRQFLAILSPDKREPFKEGSGRLELAQRIASKDNPLTARVMANRVWGYHFGASIVRTPSDFGFRSEAPTHPELLDWLALRFVEQGWSLKKLHKLMMTSAAWQQRSDDLAEYKDKDPDNRLVWKVARTRLDFEAMRDSILWASGQIDLTMGGRSVALSENPTAKQKQQAETIVNTVGDPTQE